MQYGAMTNALNRVVAVANGKGGVGKTSVAANVAGLAAVAGWETLLIDLDSQANLGQDLGYAWEGKGDEGAHLVSALVSGAPIEPVLRSVRPNLDVISGGSRLDDLDDVISGRQRRGDPSVVMLREALADLAGSYDLVLIDTPPSRKNALVYLALVAARWIVIPTKSDRSSIEGLRKLAEQVVEVRAHNPELEVLGAVLFGAGSTATVVRKHAADDIRGVLGDVAPLFETPIRHAEAAAGEARERGRLVHELAAVVDAAEPYWKALQEGRRPERQPGTAPALAEDYALLAQDLLARIASMEEGAKSA